MLWNVILPNYFSSLDQFEKLERKISKDPELIERYADTIKEDTRKDYIFAVDPHDPRKRSDREWYLPHQPVVSPIKPAIRLHTIQQTRDSPTCATFFLRKTLKNIISTYPDFATVVKVKFYVDYYLDSFEDVNCLVAELSKPLSTY